MEVNERMTANWASAVVNTLVLAFFVVVAIGIALGVYAARALKKAEQAMKKTE
jgi:ABC-type spermidine/putrescine transport system permease subunit II